MILGEQFGTFLQCAALGIAIGFLYDVLLPVRRKLPWVTEIFAAILWLAGYLFLSLLYGYPAFRLYMAAGSVMGLCFYWKSFHRIVDFFRNIVYNKRKRNQREE